MCCLLAVLALDPLSAQAVEDSASNAVVLADASGGGLPVYSTYAVSAVDEDRGPQVELAGLRVNGSERAGGIGMLRAEGKLWVALRPLMSELELSTELLAAGAAHAARVVTPIGEALLDAGQCQSINGAYFCEIVPLAASLAIDLVFDQSEFALQVRTAWPAIPSPGGESPQLRADVLAPRLSLSYARTQIAYLHDGDRNDSQGSGEFGGGLGDGFWRSAWSSDSSGSFGLYDYAWITQRDDARFLIGHQSMAIDPLLPNFDLLGAQAAFTNRPEAVFDAALESRGFVSDRFLPNQTLKGKGPPGGRAELRVDGELFDSTTISLSGDYVFARVRRALSPLAVVQVHLFERAFDTVPLRVEERSITSSDRLLPAGAVVNVAGLGVQDNPLGDPLLRRGEDGRAAGFWHGRLGISDGLTLQAAAQSSDDGEFVIAGAHLGLAGASVVSVLLGSNDQGADALRIQTDGQKRHWFWRGYLQDEDAGYRRDIQDASLSGERELRYAEGGWIGSRLMLSVVARSEHDATSGRRVDFVKPALTAQPWDTLSVSIRPGSEGDYGYLLRWAPTQRVYFNAFRDSQRDQLEANLELASNTRAVAGWISDPLLGDRYSLLGYREGVGARQRRFGAGVLESAGRVGWLLEAGVEVTSGVYFSAQALDDPLTIGAGRGGAGPTLALNLSFDLVNSGSGFVGSSYRADYSQSGSISGRIVPAGNAQAEPLSGVPVRIDGDVRAYTDEAGGFHVPALDVGVHLVEIDQEGLPLDMAPAKRVLGVEVAAGRSTALTLALEWRLGLAGRVVDAAGIAVAKAEVQLRSADGTERGTQGTDAYGYFRFSELPPGRYQLKLPAAAGRAEILREVELVDGYVFEQDLVISP